MKEHLSRRAFLELSGLGLGVLLARILPQAWVDYFCRGYAGSNKFVITLDDGWDLELVREAITVFSELGVRSSFFPVGVALAQDPGFWKDVVRLGHELHNHSFSHASFGGLSEGEIVEELIGWERQYEGLGVGQYRQRLVRPPYNEGVNNPDLYNAASLLGYEAVVGWTADSKWSFSANEVLVQVEKGIVGGGIILLHFTSADIAAIPLIVERAREKELVPVRLGELPGSPIYTRTRWTRKSVLVK